MDNFVTLMALGVIAIGFLFVGYREMKLERRIAALEEK